MDKWLDLLITGLNEVSVNEIDKGVLGCDLSSFHTASTNHHSQNEFHISLENGQEAVITISGKQMIVQLNK